VVPVCGHTVMVGERCQRPECVAARGGAPALVAPGECPLCAQGEVHEGCTCAHTHVCDLCRRLAAADADADELIGPLADVLLALDVGDETEAEPHPVPLAIEPGRIETRFRCSAHPTEELVRVGHGTMGGCPVCGSRWDVCGATFGSKDCVLHDGHDGPHVSPSGSSWPSDEMRAPVAEAGPGACDSECTPGVRCVGRQGHTGRCVSADGRLRWRRRGGSGKGDLR
jgi:hypothetical protein